jgi:hypothetical protein
LFVLKRMAENYDEIFKSTLHYIQSFSWEMLASGKPTSLAVSSKAIKTSAKKISPPPSESSSPVNSKNYLMAKSSSAKSGTQVTFNIILAGQEQYRSMTMA